jgi:hypothetical protein
MESLSLS